jgi:hypothetical protein
MKTNLALVNSIGFQNASQRAWFYANILAACVVSSPAMQLVKAVAGTPAKPAVIAQTAKPARAATAAVLGAANTTGYAFGELYLNSPAYPIGTAIPAIPAKPASLAVVGVPAVAAVPPVVAVNLPAITAIPGWENAIALSETATECDISVYLPYSKSPKLYGKSVKGVSSVLEITPPNVIADKWFDTLASSTPGTETEVELTVEQEFYETALELVAADPVKNSIVQTLYNVAGKQVACHLVTLKLTATAYDPSLESIQLPKLG